MDLAADVSDLVSTGHLPLAWAQEVPASADAAEMLIGREAERAILEKAFSDVTRGTIRMIGITGDPGTGKTRMLAQVAAIGRSRGMPILSGRIPSPSPNVPLAVLAHAFNDYISTVGDEVLNAIPAHHREVLASASPLLEFHEASGADARASGRFGCFRAVHALIEALASHGPIAITLDDLERADAETIDVVRFLMSFPPRAAVLLVLAYRDRQASPVLRSAAEMAPGLTRLPLMPLTEAQVGAWLGAEVSPTRRKALHQASDGNPGYLEELLHVAWPYPPAGADPEDTPVSRRFTTKIAAEISILSRAAILVASAAAVAGDPFNPAIVQKLAAISEGDLYPALDELASRDLIRAVPATGNFSFRHPLVRRAVYQATGPGSRLAAHTRAAGLLSAPFASPVVLAPHLARVAGAGDMAAADVLAKAASVVECDFPAAAARWLSAALRLLPDGETPDERRLVLVSGLARALAAAGQPEQACDVLQGASLRDCRDSARAVLLHARLKRQVDRPGDARGLLRAQLAAAPGTAIEHSASIGLELACTELMDGQFAEAADYAQRVASAADRPDMRPVLASALAVQATASCLAGHDLAAADILSRGVPMTDELSDGELAQRADCALWTGWAEILLDRWDEALRHFDRAVTSGRPAAEYLTVFYALAGRAVASCLAGELAAASANTMDALDVSAVARSAEMRRHALLLRRIVSAWGNGWGSTRQAVVLPANGGWLAIFALNMLAEAMLARGDTAGCFAAAAVAGAPDLSSCGRWLRARWYELLGRACARAGCRDEADDWMARAGALAGEPGAVAGEPGALAGEPGASEGDLTAPPRSPGAGVRALTWRERQVAQLVSEGLTNRAIARELSITEKTVEAHLSKVFGKLGATNRVSVARTLLHDADGAGGYRPSPSITTFSRCHASGSSGFSGTRSQIT